MNGKNAYFQLGLNVTCLSYLKNRYNQSNVNKAPSHKWRELQIRRQSGDELNEYKWQFSTGVGCVLGYNDFRCIDIDNCSDISLIHQLLNDLGLPTNYEWVVKTPNGFHVYVKCSELNMSVKELQEGVLALQPNSSFASIFERLELRWAGHSVLPSEGTVSSRYKFVFDNGCYFPQSEPKEVGYYPLYRMLIKLCGEFRFYTEDKTQYGGKIEIGNYTAKYSNTSGGGLDFEVKDKSDRLILRNENPYNSRVNNFSQKKGGTIFLDVETTGLIKNPLDYSSYPRLIQIAFKKNDKMHNYYVQPIDFSLNDEIKNLTGLTDSFLQENGLPIINVLKDVTLNLIFYIDEATEIVAHNADFDLSIIDSEYLRVNPRDLNLSSPRSPFRNGKVFDTMIEFSKVHDCKYPSLTELYNILFDEDLFRGKHNALMDTELVEKCYRLMNLYGYGV